MKNLKMHTPTGLTDQLPEVYQLKRNVERQIEATFEGYGYAFVSSPALEYLAVFEGKGSIPVTEMYKLADKTGDVLALRPDMTPAIARMTATHRLFENRDHPIRLCYIEKAFRNHERFRGRENEFTQAGAELIGVSSPMADAEVIALAIKSLLAVGLTDFRVDIGHVGFLSGILEELRKILSEEDCEDFIKHVITRNYVDAEVIAAKVKNAIPAGALLSNLPQLTGSLEVLANAYSMTTNDKAQTALRHLEAVYDILNDQGLADYVLFDLSMVGQLDYYTGLIFKGYAKGTGSTVVDGGRYDNLLPTFSKKNEDSNDIPAVGFGIKIDGLLDVLSNAPFSNEFADTLVAYAEDARSAALINADILRQQGLYLINHLQSESLEATKNYASNNNFKGIIYFVSPNNVVLINLETGLEHEVSVEELKCMM